MQQRLSSFFLAIAWLIVSVILLTLPGSAFPKEDWLDKIWFDKWAHIGIFFILVLLWSRLLSVKNENLKAKKSLLITIAIAALLYGLGMEFVQKYLIRNRAFDYGDVAANAIGCGLGLVYSLRKYIKK